LLERVTWFYHDLFLLFFLNLSFPRIFCCFLLYFSIVLPSTFYGGSVLLCLRVLVLAIMYAGYVFACGADTLGNCVRRRVFSCSGEVAEDVRDLALGSIVFLFDVDSDTLVGPFTAAGPGRRGMEPGAWTESVDELSFSGNFKVTWEELHKIENARERFPFLRDRKNCRLSQLQVEDLLDALKEGDLFRVTQSPRRKHV